MALAACGASGGGSNGFGPGGSSGSTGPSALDAAAAAGPATDAGTASDARNEAPADWCHSQAAHHLLCEDFDQGVPGSLTSKTYGGGSVAADVSEFVSPPLSLWAGTPLLPSPGAAAGARATASFGVPGSRFRLQADLQIDPGCFASGDPATLAELGFDAYSVALLVSSAGCQVVESTYDPDGGLSASTTHALTVPIPSGAWSTIVLDVDLQAKNASMSIGGVSALSGARLASAPAATSPMSFSLGAAVTNVVNHSQGCRVHVDNILFDID